MLPVASRPFDAGLVCPVCHGELAHPDAGEWSCQPCERRFGLEEGFPNFMIGERFPDTDSLELLEYEERSNEACARDYCVPTLNRVTPIQSGRAPRVLSVGCGTGVDVEILTAAGYDAVGLDPGFRSEAWPRRACPERYLFARGEHVPFEDGYFDAAIMGCVFPHVGVEGDSFQVAKDYKEQRLELARETTRLLRPGGHLIVSSPNRRFPFDLFHRDDPNRRVPRPSSPSDPFLLSFDDYRELFVDGAGCQGLSPLGIQGYWGFVNMGATFKTRLLRSVLQGWFSGVSSAAALRKSALAPWICVDVVR